ncbi:MAG TPA: hypothetical protein VJM78_05090 [Rhizomicrobium sp.]|nr:hypothetical protein [Rhizomicrobium sp.]
MTGDPGKRLLPPLPHPHHLRKQAKARLAAMKAKGPSARLADAQLILAREYGFPNWAALQAEVARRGAGPLGQRAHVRRVHLASFRPGWWRQEELPDDEVDTVAAFFRAAVILQIGVVLAVVGGLALIFWIMQLNGLLPPVSIRLHLNL